MRAVGWTVDAGPSNVASRSKQGRVEEDPLREGSRIWPSLRAHDQNRRRKPSISGTARRANELRLQRCDSCAHVYFPPRPFCPACASRKVSVFKASGKARLYSYVIHHRPVPGFTPPYAIAVVELEEGPRMMSNIVDCPQTPEALELDMKLEVAFEKLDDDITLPLFRPAKG